MLLVPFRFLASFGQSPLPKNLLSAIGYFIRVFGENEPKWRLRFQVGIGHGFAHALSSIQISGFVRTVAATEKFAIGYFARAFGENDRTIR
jgi:hypothetical protein